MTHGIHKSERTDVKIVVAKNHCVDSNRIEEGEFGPSEKPVEGHAPGETIAAVKENRIDSCLTKVVQMPNQPGSGSILRNITNLLTPWEEIAVRIVEMEDRDCLLALR